MAHGTCCPRSCLDRLYSEQLTVGMAMLCTEGKFRLTASRLRLSAMQALMVCVVALNLGCMVAYLNVLADLLSSVGGSIIPPGAEENRALLLAGENIIYHKQESECGSSSGTQTKASIARLC